jgi:hypothetical protein
MGGIDSDDLGHENFDILLIAQYCAYRSCDLVSRKQARRDLIQHRSKEVIVALIN